MGDKASKTTDTIVDGTKSTLNTTVDTTNKVAHDVWDGTKNTASSLAEGTKHAASNVAEGTKAAAAAGAKKTEEAWEGIYCRELPEFWPIFWLFRPFFKCFRRGKGLIIIFSSNFQKVKRSLYSTSNIFSRNTLSNDPKQPKYWSQNLIETEN